MNTKMVSVLQYLHYSWNIGGRPFFGDCPFSRGQKNKFVGSKKLAPIFLCFYNLEEPEKGKNKKKYQNNLSFTLLTLLMEYKLGDLFLGISHFQWVRKKCLWSTIIGTNFYGVLRTMNDHKNKKIENEHQK